jgi:hypothetical protein
MSLAGICTALAAVSVTASGKTPQVLNYDALRPALTTAALPARLIFPFGSQLSAAMRALTIAGTPKQVDWQIVDLLLWETAGQTRGIATMAPILTAYIDAYMLAIRSHVRLVTSPVAVIERVSFVADILTYGGHDYWGVETTLTVKESG